MTQLIADSSSLRAGSTGPATGTLWLNLGSRAFPAEGWNDFVVVILAAWAHAALRLLRGASPAELVHFMDGPFEVRTEVTPAGEWLLIAIERGRGRVCSATIRPNAFVGQICSAGDNVLEASRGAGTWSSDADSLQEGVEQLKEAVMRLKN